MSRYDANPFAEEDVNPFADGKGLSPLPPERYDRGATIDIPLDNSRSLKDQEKDLKAREAELKRREQEIKRKEENVKKAGGFSTDKNWPPFYPIIHHDIANEIPIHLQKIQYVALTTYLGLVVTLLWNIIAVTVFLFHGGGIINWIMSVIYFVTTCPLAYFLWYRPLYRAMRTDSSLSFAGFFLCYTFHIGFCIYCALAPPIISGGLSLTGILSAIALITLNQVTVAIFFFIGFGMFVIETLMSIWVLKQVLTYFRSSGKAQDMKRDAVRAAI
ncbi:secretory carrier-associated membrane protein 1-like [Rosa rugosa]|uniref:secretory carrier-associated membrane protein 1-like n=1 Tax=Rosa rugosa TaxID=74645 RepID=UPI002B40164B|nr:secretory carrier-associated membrane protein 1-like [Rosa rugosa]